MSITQTEEEKQFILEEYEDLIAHAIRAKTDTDKELIFKAFNFANHAHMGVRRKSGEPYITHPLAVAKIVSTELGLGAKSIASALLHDVVEDTEYTIEDIEDIFGQKIASIISGLTKISGVFDSNASIQAENFRKMLLTLSDDVRVIMVKLADRLHNMRTLGSMPKNKQYKIASETVYLYAPLAHRLGLYAIKTELEDLSLKYRDKQAYDDLRSKIKDSEKHRLQEINKFSLPIINKLEKSGFEFNINGRPKSIYSIWRKMQEKKVSFEEVYDLLAIRITFEPKPNIPEKNQCWDVYSLITDIYKPKPERIRDWVSTPKINGYEALHVTVMGPEGKWIEVQIRTTRMDEIAERGFAAHWKYKSLDADESELDKWIKKIREMLENPNQDALEFLDEFKMNLFSSEIIVFTPKGRSISLPKNASALDFAYEIHSEIGNKAIAAKVNHKLVALSLKLQSGDQVEILTSNKQRPHRDWLDFAKTAKAKSNIKNALKAENKNRVFKGKTILEKELAELGLQPNSRIIKKLLPAYDVLSKDELYSLLGSEIITLDNLKKVLKRNSKNKIIKYWGLSFGVKKKKEVAEKDTYILRENIEQQESNYRIAKCCNPIPGDEVIGFKKDKNNILIHKTQCKEATRLMSSHGDLIVNAAWTTHKFMSFLTGIRVQGIDKMGIVADLTRVISDDLDVNMRNINIQSHDGIFEGEIQLYVHNSVDLNDLILNLIKIKGIDTVTRIEIHED